MYIPLGGSKGTKYQQIRNVFIIFLVSGFWHGANWTFIVWGALNAFYFLPLLLTNNNRNHIEIVANNKNCPSFIEFFHVIATFALSTIAWIFFRAENVPHAFQFLKGVFNWSLFSVPQIRPTDLFILISFFVGIEWIGRRNLYALEIFGFKWKRPFRLLFYYSLSILIFWYSRDEQTFIYFQF